MCYHKLSHPLVGIMALLLLIGCNAPAATPVPTTTPVPPTAIPPTPTTPVSIMSVETLIGNWQPLSDSHDATFLQINPDGTCRQAYTFERLTNVPEVECTYTFERTVFALTVVELHGVPECPSPTARYELVLVADNQIQLIVADDTCTPRIRSTQGVYQRIP